MSHHLTARARQTPCASMLAASADPASPQASWDLDIGDGPAWARAIEICASCPLQVMCRQQLVQDYPGALQQQVSHSPRGVIWAGVAYSEGGRALKLAELRVLHVQRRNAAERAPALQAA
jgi:hypothetical protein